VRTAAAFLLASLLGLVGRGEAQPQLLAAKVVELSASAGLQPAIQGWLKSDLTRDSWIAYSVPIIPGELHVCCFNSGTGGHTGYCCGTCRLEPHPAQTFTADGLNACHATLAAVLYVFLSTKDGQIDQLRTFSSDCTIDAAGDTVYWLTGVVPAQSVIFLESRLQARELGDRSRARTEEILAAIAMHADASADAVLEKSVQPGQPDNVREQAAFWIGNSRGNHGLDILIPLIKSDNQRRFLDQAIFAISQNSERDRAFKELVQLARRDPRSEVREQALFWLAQEAGGKAAGVITASIENDPETDVKKKAVFALSELPKDEGVPLLIEQARKNKNPVVRKEAVFWLGQSEDPRALDFITSILEH
jgi:hypothetical protein